MADVALQPDYSFFVIVAVIIGIFVLVIAIFVFGYFQAKKRREAIAMFARSKGFNYQERFDPYRTGRANTIELTQVKNAGFDSTINPTIKSTPPSAIQMPGISFFGMKLFDPWPIDKLPWLGFNLFSVGSSKNIENFLKREASQEDSIIFDYSYTIHHSGKNSSNTTYTQTVILTKQIKPLPRFELFFEGIFGKIADIVGFKDIDFESNKEFSDKYRLKGEDENGIRQVFTSPLLNFLVSNRVFERIESNGQYLLFYSPSKLIKVEELASRVDSAIKINQMFSLAF